MSDETQENNIQDIEQDDANELALEEKQGENKDASESGQFTEGEILDFVRVRFPGHAKSYPFLTGKKKYQYGQKIVGMSDRGMAVGYINSFPYKLKFQKSMLPLRSINKIADNDDENKDKENFDKEKEAQDLCIKLIKKHELDMGITHVEFTQFGKKAVFYFVAPQRVDFRGLVKDLVSEMKMRIELRQISIRDRAASLGGIGPCGRQLCCSSFLTSYGKVNIKMAKNQNLSLIPTRLNGLCGQLKCCTQYENEVYTHKRKFLPESGKFITVKNGDTGKVLKLHVLIEQFEMLTDQGKIKRYTVDQWDPKVRPAKDWSFPKDFDYIVNETKNIIGLSSEEEQAQKISSYDNIDNVPFFSSDNDEDDIDEAAIIIGEDESDSDLIDLNLEADDDEDESRPKGKLYNQEKFNQPITSEEPSSKKARNNSRNNRNKKRGSRSKNNSQEATANGQGSDKNSTKKSKGNWNKNRKRNNRSRNTNGGQSSPGSGAS